MARSYRGVGTIRWGAQDGKDGVNYLIMGWWSASVHYKLTDAGIPVVKVEDNLSNDGFSVYKLTALQSTLGTFIVSEWEKVKSADFVYMQDAYIEHLQAELITAERIEALDIVHPSGLYSLIGGKLKVQDAEIEGTVNANSGKVGYLDIDAGGSLILRDEEGETRLLITKGDVTPIADIGSKVQNSTENNSQLDIHYMLSGGVENYVQAKKMVIMNDNTHLTISTSISISISTFSGFKLSQGRGRVYVKLRRVGLPNNYILLGEATVQVDKLSGEPSVDSTGVITISKSMLIDTGTYEIAAEVWMEATEGDHHLYTLQGTLGASTMVARFDAANRRTEIGKNGIGIIVDANNYMCVVKEGNGFKVIARTNGVFDMPGVLASGTVNTNGGLMNEWGAKINYGQTITGGYRIFLKDMTHNKYSVQVTPHTNVTFRVSTKTSTYFDILGTGAADFVVFGSNY